MSSLPKPLRELDAALAALSGDSMMLSQLDGLVAALLLCPEPIPPEAWLPLVWGEGEGEGDDKNEEDDAPSVFASDGEAARVTALVLDHRDRIEWILRNTPEDYAPILDHHAATGETFWEFWIEAFELGMSLRPEAWAPVIERPAPDEAPEALSLLLALYQIMTDDPDLEPSSEQVELPKANAADLIPECVAVLAETLLEPAPRPVPIQRPKVGRNDPCPCGSGKKYKKCCGAAA